jgi:formylglycine-generating enzyme required for sulfatase activity
LMQCVQLRGVLADAGISDRGLVVLFGELASEGILYAWWCFEESACEDAMRTIRALGMESVASPILMRNVLAHRVSPEQPTRSPAPDLAGSARLVGAAGRAAQPNLGPTAQEVLASDDMQRLHQAFADVQQRLRQAPLDWSSFARLAEVERARVQSSVGCSDVRFRIVVSDDKVFLRGYPAPDANVASPANGLSGAKSSTPTNNPRLAPEPGLRNSAAALVSGSTVLGPHPPIQRALSRSSVTQLPAPVNRMLRRVLTGSIILLLVGLAAWALTYVGVWPALRGLARIAPPSMTEVACPAGFVPILPGSFSMGSSVRDEIRYPNEAQRTVTITRAFCIQSTEVTQAEFLAVMGNNPSRFSSCGLNCPVERVSWEDAVAFANQRSRSEGLPQCYNGATSLGLACAGYRLPTAAEWEYAARAGSGNADTRNLEEVAWFAQNSGNRTHPVAQKLPNAWGLYDTSGNVYEWTGDWFDDFNGSGADPVGPAEGSTRENRGGSWLNTPVAVRPTYRGFDTPTFRSDLVGVRLVRSVF